MHALAPLHSRSIEGKYLREKKEIPLRQTNHHNYLIVKDSQASMSIIYQATWTPRSSSIADIFYQQIHIISSGNADCDSWGQRQIERLCAQLVDETCNKFTGRSASARPGLREKVSARSPQLKTDYMILKIVSIHNNLRLDCKSQTTERYCNRTSSQKICKTLVNCQYTQCLTFSAAPPITSRPRSKSIQPNSLLRPSAHHKCIIQSSSTHSSKVDNFF